MLRLRSSTLSLRGSTCIIRQSIFEKIDNHGPKDACRDFRCAQDKSSFEKFLLAFAAPFCIDVNFFLSHRQQNDHCADGGCGCKPGDCLFSKRSPELPGKIQFILQTAQVARYTRTSTADLTNQPDS